MRQLIVNADDLGADEARNAGIFEAIRGGSVTSVSILANGPALEDALQEIRSLREKKISWGIHLNLSEGTPRLAGLRRLTGPEGCFLGKARPALLSDPRDPDETQSDAQVLVLSADILPTSMDTSMSTFSPRPRAAVNLARGHRTLDKAPREPDGTRKMCTSFSD
jgi:hypothetical protein